MQAITIQTLEIPEANSLDKTAFSLVVQSKELSSAVYTLTDFYSDPISGNIGLSCLKTETRNYESLRYTVSIENGALEVKEGQEALQELFSAVKQNPLVKGTRFCRRRRAEGVFIEFRGTGRRNKDKYCAALVVCPVANDGSELAPIISYLPWKFISGGN
ncbi:hypothetical protein IQ249_15280 [Lusitaniella coriacea LEGE 07157]|uniref:Uncharacterized protein n=1 Tax=Lusitaniella coriacea LEGE 07157 TaxID=945747 RepID=A0A8J7DXK0_9CYAN|nr:hypothetical protein [Lusitaniella coriacea]MBE9117262.1 hypothetical protein [Lusitaniella coriacea LEGE 07157]